MNKEQQIEKDRLIQIEEIDELIREKFHGQVAYRMDISKYGGFNGYTPLCTYDISKALYNAGYRKTFTSDLASDTQKAYKEGYIKGIEEREAEIEILKIQNKNRGYQPPQYSNGYKPTITPKPAPPKCPTPSPKSISIDTFKEMNAMCNIADHRKQAVKEFAEKLKKKVHNYYPSIDSYCTSRHVILVKDIDELLKEYEK